MAYYKCSLVLSVVTTPTQAQVSSPHAGGWSEQFWRNGDALTLQQAQLIAQARANMLPRQCQVIGMRQQLYQIVGNILRPGGSAIYTIVRPGASNWNVDVPQACLNLVLTAAGSANKGRYTLRGLPDDVVENGEFAPDNAFTLRLTQWRQLLASNGIGFIARDLAAVTTDVLGSATVNVVVRSTAGLAANDYVRFLKVHNLAGESVEGSFQVGAIVDGTQFTTIPALAETLAQGGKVRKDLLVFLATSEVGVGRVGVRKIGRPSSGYRGRRSRMRKAS